MKHLHVVRISWLEHGYERPPSESVGFLVATLRDVVLLSGSWNAFHEKFPVTYAIPNEDIIDMRTVLLIPLEEDGDYGPVL